MLAEKSGKQTIVCRPATWISAAIFPHPTSSIRVAAAAGASKGAAESVEVGLARCGTGASPRTSACSGSCPCSGSCSSASTCSSTSALRWAFCLWRTISPDSKKRVQGIGHVLVALAGVSATLEKCGVVCGLILLADDLKHWQRKQLCSEFVTEPENHRLTSLLVHSQRYPNQCPCCAPWHISPGFLSESQHSSWTLHTASNWSTGVPSPPTPHQQPYPFQWRDAGTGGQKDPHHSLVCLCSIIPNDTLLRSDAS